MYNKIVKSDFIRRIIVGSFWLSIGTGVSRLIISFGYVYLARILNQEEYGKFGMLKSTIDSFLVFATAGLGLTTTKYVAQFREKKTLLSSILGLIFTTALVVGTSFSIVLVVFSGFITKNWLNDIELNQGFQICAVTILFSALNSIILGTLLGFEDFKSQMKINIFQGFAIGFFISIGASFFRLEGAIWGFMLAILLTFLLSLFFVKRRLLQNNIKLTTRKFKYIYRQVFSFTIPLVLSSLITSPVLWVLNAILSNQEGGYKQMGIYNAVYIFPAIILMMNSMISNSILPVLLQFKGDINVNQNKFRFLINWIVAIFMVLFIASFPNLLTQVLGSNYSIESTKGVLIWSLGSTLLIAHRQGIALNLIEKSKMIYSVLSMGQWGLTTIVLFLYFPVKDANSLALCIFIGYVINTLLFVPFFVRKNMAPRGIFFNKWSILLMFFSLIFLFTNYLDIDIYIKVLFYLIQNLVLLYIVLKFFNYDSI